MQHASPTITTGATLSATGNLCIGLGFLAAQQPHPLPLRRLGLALMVAGECLNFAAYGMAPVALVASLDAVAMVAGPCAAMCVYRPPTGRARSRMGAGAAMAAIGVLVTVLHAPTAEEHDRGYIATYHRIASWTTLTAFLAPLSVAWAAVANPLGLSILLPRSARHAHPLPLCFLSGLMSAVTVLCARGLSAAARHALRTGSTAMMLDAQGGLCWHTHLLALALAAAVALQMRYLGQAFGAGFGHARVIALYYVCFTAATAVAGGVVFGEVVFAGVGGVVAFGLGLGLVYAGLLVLSCGEVVAGDAGGGGLGCKDEAV
jgi:hypothetical protein